MKPMDWAGKTGRVVLGILMCVQAMMTSGPAYGEISDTERRLRALEEKYEANAERWDWLNKFSFKADLRLRHESNFRDSANIAAPAVDRHRQRIRFRIGGTFSMYKDLDIVFRFVTGEDDPVSTNQTLDDGFDTKAFNFDRGYAKFHKGPVTLRGGKFGVPFMKSELVWDSDLSMEGAVEQFKFDLGPVVTLILGQFPVEEFSGGQDDPNLFAYQLVVEEKLDLGKIKAAAGYFDYNALRGNKLPTSGGSGNTLDAAGNHVFNFDILDFIGELHLDPGIPLTFFGEYAHNTAESVVRDDAWQAGIKVGKKPRKWADWQARLIYREVEPDAVLGTFSDSDFHEGGTNSKGIEAGLKVGLRKGIAFNFTFFSTEELTGPKADLQRLQGDVVFTF